MCNSILCHVHFNDVYECNTITMACDIITQSKLAVYFVLLYHHGEFDLS